MTKAMKLRKVGSSLGFTVPKDVLHDLGLQEGDNFYLVRTPEGVLLTPYDPDFAEVLDDGRDYMRRHRNAMKKLAEG